MAEDTKIEMKIDEEIKPLKELCDKLVKMATAEMEQNPAEVDTHEMGEVIDMIYDLAKAKKEVAETCYKKKILAAMEESEYGEDYDENGPKKYYTKGMSIRTYPMTVNEYQNARDMDMPGRRYYSDGSNRDTSTSGNNSQEGGQRYYTEVYDGMGYSGRGSYDARRYYMDTKEMHRGNTAEDKEERMKGITMYLRELKPEIMDMLHDASNSERTAMKSGLQNIIAML